MEQTVFAPPPTYRPTDRISIYRPPKRRRGFLARSGWLRLARRLLVVAAAGALFALSVGSASASNRCTKLGCTTSTAVSHHA